MRGSGGRALVGDVQLVLPGGAQPQVWAARLISLLEEHRVRALALAGVRGHAGRGGSSVDAPAGWAAGWLLFCRAFLGGAAPQWHGRRRVRHLSSFTLFCAGLRVVHRRSPHAGKRLRSIRRRQVKRVTREAVRRLWPFG